MFTILHILYVKINDCMCCPYYTKNLNCIQLVILYKKIFVLIIMTMISSFNKYAEFLKEW